MTWIAIFTAKRECVAPVAPVSNLGFCFSGHPGLPTALAGISWGGKLTAIVAGRHPELVNALALICPGLHPRVGVSRKERLQIAWAFFTNRRKTFPIPLSDPALAMIVLLASTSIGSRFNPPESGLIAVT